MPYLKTLRIEPLNIKGLTPEQNLSIVTVLEAELERWRGTPYLPGQNMRGRGVDCVHFVASIYDYMIGKDYSHQKLPQDTSFHNKALAEAGLRNFFRAYPCHHLDSNIVQPGDYIICGPIGINGGPGHGMIVGRNSLWHVDNRHVCKAGLSIAGQGGYRFKQVRRLDDRTTMLRGKR